MRLEFGFGEGSQTVELPEDRLLGILHPVPPSTSLPEKVLIHEALEHPIGSPKLEEILHPGERVAIISSDITRPMPTARVMPHLLKRLYQAGIAPGDITLVFALGSHRPHTGEEIRRLAGEQAWREIQCVDSCLDGTVYVGTTALGTPVDIDRRVVEADRRICLGNIEYHYFAGYSGGAKAIMPGVSTQAAIQANHRRMVEPKARVGQLEGNPVRMDLEEAAGMVGIDFILNVVLDEHKRIVYAAAGDWIQAHRAGCAQLDRCCRVPIPAQADIVIVSQGGAPKDINLYQTQKALDNAKHAVKPGGIIILIGACSEGLGNKTFETWMTEAATPHSLVERIHKEFRLGGHKAAAIAMVLERADIYLVSELKPELVRQIFLTPFSDVEEAYRAALERCGPKATVLAMPFGGSTLPELRAEDKITGGKKMDYASESLKKHYEWRGKLEITPRAAVDSSEALSLAYTPGVAQPCLEIQKDVEKSFALTRRWNTVAVVTDGTAVLGLGDIGPEAGMPVMEGKCVLFKAFGGVDAIPLCIRSKDVDQIVDTVALLSGSFGGINLEDISAPRCFEIERRLKERCDIPVFHDDQHGTAVVTLAGLLNALKLVGKHIEDVKIVTSGAGAAGIAIVKLLMSMGLKSVVMTDRVGAICQGREGLTPVKEEMAAITNFQKEKGSLAEVIRGADVFIGVSAPGTLTREMVHTMASDAIIFACANPTPEIFPEEAKLGGAAVVSTGRSDFPNQVNNVLAFPGIFRGALDVRARDINDAMKVAAARAIADLVSSRELNAEYILPAAFDPRVRDAVSAAVAQAARESGVAALK